MSTGLDMLEANTRIAKTETVESWCVAREWLANDPTQEQLEDVFKRFLEGRLESRCSDDGEGFAIVTLYCSIIEFLASIRTGQNYKYRHSKSARTRRPNRTSARYCSEDFRL